MSTTSTVTTLVAHNCTLGDDTKSLTHMCVLVIARVDGTPFDAASVWEEYIIELCVEVGWANPKGVCYSCQQWNQSFCFDLVRK